MTFPRLSTSSTKRRVAVATAAIPVVVLSSFVMAGTATAAPAQAEPLAHGNHGTLDGKKVLAAVQSRTSKKSIPAAVVAGTMPRVVPTGTQHTVQDGDTLWGIAASHEVSLQSLLTENNISAEKILMPGQVLSISGTAAANTGTDSASGARVHVVRAGETLSGIAATYQVGLSTLFALNNLSGDTLIHPGQSIKTGGASQSAPTPAAQQAGGGYVIRAGDTLTAIAAQHEITVAALAAANGTTANGTIYAGKSLTIPGVATASSDLATLAPSSSAPADLPADQQVSNTFLHYTYPDAVVGDANRNKAALLAAPSPSQGEMRELVANTAASMGVNPALALAFAEQESSFNHQSVSPANAIGTMQVIPDSGEWASGLVGRQLNLLDPHDNVTAGLAIIRALHQGAATEDEAIAGYYQGQYSVSINGLFPDSVDYVAGVKAKREMYR